LLFAGGAALHCAASRMYGIFLALALACAALATATRVRLPGRSLNIARRVAAT